MKINDDDYFAHYGTPRESGRYPWGSGGNDSAQLPRNMDLLQHIENMKKKGLTEPQIAKGLNMSTTRMRALKSIAKTAKKQDDINQAWRLHEEGNSNVAIGKLMGIGESSVRALLAPGAADKADNLTTITDMLKEQVAEKKYIDVGTGTEHHIPVPGVTATKLNLALAVLKEQGYEVHPVKILQQGTGRETRLQVLAAPGTTQREVFLNRDKIKLVSEISEDGGRTFIGMDHPPMKIDPKRVQVIYGPDGGNKADGVIYVRPGVPDVSLGNARYAQVRIAVGDNHYLKGMAMYKEGLPDGIDLAFNTPKLPTGNKLDAMKENEKNLDGSPAGNPFGTSVKRQIVTKDAKGKEKLTSVMNIVHEEGNWAEWSKTISTQMLSKQSPRLAKTQLDMTYEKHLKEFEDLSKLTNPTVKKLLLEKFGDSMDSSAVHMEAAGIDQRQSWHAILPISSMPPTQIYAPRFNDGETVVLIRFPHAGTFEIPELTVNNNQPEAKRLLGPNPKDAVGIHFTVAERLSGADFDGDTVLVIPNNSRKVKSTPALEGLKNFDARASYPPYEGMPKMTSRQKGQEMGKISNLITDMTIKNAPPSEIVRAVKHSMVVIDAEKHNLNYKASFKDNNIGALKEKYQGSTRSGAATLFSRAGAKVYIPEREPRKARDGGAIDKETGRRVFVDTGRINTKTGDLRGTRVKKLSTVDDAHALVSEPTGTPMERLYADHSNKLKTLANRARKDSVNTPLSVYSSTAAKTYAKEVASLNSKLTLAQRARPLERQAQIIAASTIKAKLDANPNLDDASRKKVKYQALEDARIRTGAKKKQIVIEQDEWDAIQAGALSDNKLQQIFAKSDIDTVRKLATPRDTGIMTSAMTKRAQAMLNSGFTRAEVSSQLGVSLTTLDTVTDVEHSDMDWLMDDNDDIDDDDIDDGEDMGDD